MLKHKESEKPMWATDTKFKKPIKIENSASHKAPCCEAEFNQRVKNKLYRALYDDVLVTLFNQMAFISDLFFWLGDYQSLQL